MQGIVSPIYDPFTGDSEDVVVLRLEKSSESQLKGEFSALITFAIRVLERKGDGQFKEFKSYIITYFSLDSTILRATGYREVFDQISQEDKWNYLDFEPLFVILGHFIGKESEEMCSDYRDAIKAYYATKKLTKIMSETELTKRCHEDEPLEVTVHEIQMKLHPHKVTERSLSYIHSVWDSVSCFFSLPSLTRVVMLSLDTEADYLCATLPPKTSNPLLGQGEQSWKEFMRKNNIMEMSLDNGHVYRL